MSAKPSPEEQTAPNETPAEEQNAEVAAAGDNQPQAGADESGPAAADVAESDRHGSAESAAAEAASGETQSPEARIAELEAQVADLTDRLLRAHAEMDNIRKRAEREKLDTAKYAITKFAS